MNRPALDIKHLEMIVALADTPRVTEAAEKLRITPSALSHRLREVERRLELHRRGKLPSRPWDALLSDLERKHQ